MILHYTSGKESDEGFIYIASRKKLFYELALLSCESLRDFYPNAHITLFTHKSFVDQRSTSGLFDKVYVDIPIHSRAKMWCMARTPYERSIYNDVDTLICHHDIKKAHSLLDDCDLFCGSHLIYPTTDIDYAFIDLKRKIPIVHHGSFWGYHKTDLNIDFMQTWFDEYVKQITSPWPYKEYSKKWKEFDMFPLWRLTSKRFDEFKRFNDLNIKVLPRRWNTTIQDLPEDLDGPRVITQIDKDSWKLIPHAWKIIEKGINDERSELKERPFGQTTLVYD